jgi:hypothetical protein
LDATPAQLEFVDRELARFVQAGAWEACTCSDYVSILVLVPKPGNNHWRLIYDLRPLNKYCVRKLFKMETLLGAKHLTRKGDYMFSFDLHDSVYGLGINPTDHDYLLHSERARKALPTRRATYGVVPMPIQFLQDDANLRKLSTTPDPKLP